MPERMRLKSEFSVGFGACIRVAVLAGAATTMVGVVAVAVTMGEAAVCGGDGLSRF